MSKSSHNPRLGWRFYLVLYVIYAAGTAWNYYRPGSQVQYFYHLLVAFRMSYLIPMVLNEVSVILNILAIIPYIFYAEGVRALSPGFWRTFFWSRLVFEAGGKMYVIKTLQATVVDAPRFALYSVAAAALILIPSYVALYRLGGTWNVKCET